MPQSSYAPESTFEKTLSEQGIAGGPEQTRAPHLVLVCECERPLAGPSRFSLAQVDEVLIGRGPKRSVSRAIVDGARRLTVHVPDAWMSKPHAWLRRSAGRFLAVDEGSRNGSFVNGVRADRTPIDEDDVIELGHTVFQVVYDLATPEGTQDFDGLKPGADDSRLTTLMPALAMDFASVIRVAASEVPILLRGETGTGKEVVARAIHATSNRSGPLVAVNCGALPDALVESQLFGYAKGAFSGALRDEPGLVRASSGGTLFLDEIGDLSPAGQESLLRVLQEHEVLAIGATRPTPVDLRVVSATHRPLESMVKAGEFRADLLARLSGFSVTLAPLRARRPDIGLLLASILRELAGERAEPLTLRVATARALLRYDWPFNVRELRQCLSAALALASGPAIEPSHLPAPIGKCAEPASEKQAPEPRVLDESGERLRAELEDRLRQHQGNVSEVARSFGRARMQIHRWMVRFDLDPRKFRGGR
jgi:DNA-binding NtrC family response regulator